VRALSVGLRNLSTGNLTQPIEEPFAEDYETLRLDFNNTLDTLTQTIAQVVEASESIRARSAEISHASEDLSARTENQAATLEETAAALDELTASVKSAAEGAREVEKVVNQARTEATESGTVVQGAVDAMNEIERSSEQISQIIGVIDDIAFQTNLLALNAGVEAARAGDAGRGFAVVASEVRALAQRSSAAAKEIKLLISASTQHVDRGVDQVGRAGSALARIVDRVTEISSLVSDIASGAREQSVGLAEVNIGVTQLDQVTQHNAAMVEESTAASLALKQEAAGMATLVAQFALRAGQRRDGAAGLAEAPARQRRYAAG
jgi:methyl-accepting chemotaxis protein